MCIRKPRLFVRLVYLFVCLFVVEFNDNVMEYSDYLRKRDSRRDPMADYHVITLGLHDRSSHGSILHPDVTDGRRASHMVAQSKKFN
jgi:hypothetical protein